MKRFLFAPPSVVVDVSVEVQAEGTPESGNLLQFSDSPPTVDTDIETKIEVQTTPPTTLSFFLECAHPPNFF